MTEPLIVFGLVGAFIVYLVISARKAGPPTLPETDLARAVVLRSATRENPGSGWSWLGSETTANGLDLRFDADDDPKAEASFLVEDRGGKRRSSFALTVRVPLTPEFVTHHVHNSGYVFRVRLRGTEPVVGKKVKIQMHTEGKGKPIGGRVENDENDSPAVGGWIEFESVEVLRVGGRRA